MRVLVPRNMDGLQEKTRHPLKDFFSNHFASLPSKARQNTKESFIIVKDAFVLRNFDGGLETRAQTKMLAAQIIGNLTDDPSAALGAALAIKLSSLSRTAGAMLGGLAGAFLGNTLGYGVAWYVFNQKRFGEMAFAHAAAKFFREWGAAILVSVGGTASYFDRKMKGRIDSVHGFRKKLLQIARPAAYAAGLFASPTVISYYIFAPILIGCMAIGMPAAAAAVAGGIGSTAIFAIMSTGFFQPYLKEMDAWRQAPKAGKAAAK